MNKALLIVKISLLAVFAACAATNDKTHLTRDEIDSDEKILLSEDSVVSLGGLGPIVYDEETRVNCKPRARTGSRIRRNHCEPLDGIKTFDGLVGEQMNRAPINQRRVGK